MDLAIAKSLLPVQAEPELPPAAHQGEAGTSTGVNLSPGSEDDGWTVPPPVVLHDGTRLQLYKDGEALHAAYEAIKHAKHRICLEVYIFADDPTGRAFADLLCAKAQEGVNVYVIYDSFGSITTDRRMFEKMRRAGVRIEEFHPIRPWEGRFSWRPFNRDHRKLLVVDYDKAGMGGLNVGGEYAGSWVVQSSEPCCDAWRDTAIGMVGPSAKYLLRAFKRSWEYIQRGGRIREAEFMHGIDVHGMNVRPAARNTRRAANEVVDRVETPPDLSILASVATMDSPLRPLLHRLFREARQSIKLTMAYFAPDDDLIGSICKAAKRGVKVRLMLPGKCDVPALIIAQRSFYTRLLEAGVEIYERQGAVLHSKTMVIDREVSVVGSTNLDYRSIEYNNELSAVIRSKEFGQQMKKLFDNDVKFAKKITLKEWRRRPWINRAISWSVIRARYLL